MEKVSHTDILMILWGSDHCPVLLTLIYKYFNYILFKYLYKNVFIYILSPSQTITTN